MGYKKYQLPKEFATKWVNELKTTDKKQGRGYYYNNRKDCYCALGIGFIANDVEISDTGKSVNDYDLEFRLFLGNYGNNNHNDSLYEAIWKMNDIQELPFPLIGEWVEQNVEFI